MSVNDRAYEDFAAAMTEDVGPRVDISGIKNETDPDKISGVAFELYKEACLLVGVLAHLLDEQAATDGGWPRNQAICAGLLVRISKLMLVVVQLSAKGDRSEVVIALSRSIMESAINMEFLVSKNEDKFFDQFVEFSLGPERELYDLVKTNVAARGDVVLPIEQRMLSSIEDVCRASRVKIEDVKQKHGDWGGGLRQRLKALGREEQYLSIQRIPSHMVHGTWVDLYKNHLKHDTKTDRFNPDSTFSWVDARALGPIAVFVLDAASPYVKRYFHDVPQSELLLQRIDDLQARIHEVDGAHEKLMA